MASIPLAFSVQGFISTVGADAGFAAIIGLALLVLLYFSQARETATLREEAEASARRVQQLETRLAELRRSEPPVAPAPAGVPSRQTGSAARRAAPRVTAARAVSGSENPGPAPANAPAAGAQSTPAPPAGVGAPPLTAATKSIPSAPQGAPSPQAAPRKGQEPRATADEQRSDATVLAPGPATVAGGANGAPQDAQSAPRTQARPASAAPGARRPPSAPAALPGPQGARLDRTPLLLLGALAVAAVVAVLLMATSGSGQQAYSSSNTNAASAQQAKQAAAAFKTSSITVSVLNGTATSELAHRTALRLRSVGYKQGTIATASDQTRTATVVGYVPGHRADALHVAKSLKLGAASVQPLDQSTQEIACPPHSACPATVVVTVGADLATQ